MMMNLTKRRYGIENAEAINGLLTDAVACERI
jgi:hypothetical protein